VLNDFPIVRGAFWGVLNDCPIVMGAFRGVLTDLFNRDATRGVLNVFLW
jgi:hypothetical protein